MKKNIKAISVIAIINILIIILGVKTLYNPTYEPLDLSLVEQKMITLVNEYRTNNNASPLLDGTWLKTGAQQRADEMADHGDLRYIDQVGTAYKHTRPDGSEWDTVFSHLYGTEDKPRYLSENIALTEIRKKANEDDLAKQMFKQWKNSPGHNETMLDDENKSFSFKISEMSRRVGSEYIKSDSKTYIGVQIFDSYSSAK